MKQEKKRFLLIIAIVLIFLASRLYTLDKVPAWEDNFSWLYRINYYPWLIEKDLKGINDDGKGLAYSGSISYHPGVTVMTFSGISTRIGKKILHATDPGYVQCNYNDRECRYLARELVMAKIPLILVSSLALFLCLYVLRCDFGAITPLVFGMIVVLEPVFYRSSRDLHLDFLQSIFITTAFLWYTKGKDARSGVISGISYGLALLTRFASVMVVPSFVITGFLNSGIKTKAKLKELTIFFLIAFATFFFMFPAMWVAPIGTLEYIVEGSIGNIQSYGSDSSATQVSHTGYLKGLGEYLMLYMNNISIVWTALFIGALLFWFWNIRKKYHRDLTTTFIFFLVFFLLLNVADKRFFRYLTPVIMGLSVFISIAWGEILKVIRSRLVRN